MALSSMDATEQGLWADYYDEQLDMLRALQPRVIGHFDLIRLLSDRPGRDAREWPAVWEKILRNLEVVKEQGGWLECNSAALRKGLDEPYPCRTIAEVSCHHPPFAIVFFFFPFKKKPAGAALLMSR